MTRRTIITGCSFVLVGVLLALWQNGFGRLGTGMILAVPWLAAAVLILVLPHIGGWLGAAVALAYLVLAAWVSGQAWVGSGRDIALQFYADAGGHFSWADVAIVSIGLMLLFAVTLTIALWQVRERSGELS